jgi:SOUL heme-binding protein
LVFLTKLCIAGQRQRQLKTITMGSVFGKETVAEPPFTILLDRPDVPAPYQIRTYGKRVAIETSMHQSAGDRSPFMKLASYIGVMGAPANEGGEAIAMTAPVMKSGTGGSSIRGTKIAMTAPVVRDESVMQFVLPLEYDSVAKAPKPNDSTVIVKELPAASGAVHRYSGSMESDFCAKKALALAEQLRKDGLDIDDETATASHSFWGYNPPFTLPMLRRNEVWIPLSEQQVQTLRASVPSAHQGAN